MRFCELLEQLQADQSAPEAFIDKIFDPEFWITAETVDAVTARLDLELVTQKARVILDETDAISPEERLRLVARRLRYQIATREPFAPDETVDLHVSTFWAGKGLTADHVYLLGLCDAAIPGTRRDEYPGTEAEYLAEQKRLFYVSITRSKKTLVLSRAKHIRGSEAMRLGLLNDVPPYSTARLAMSRFLRDIIPVLPRAVNGEDWLGC
jgi:superfamily I DNA/RNA helicase